MREVQGYLEPSPDSVSCRKELGDLLAEDGQYDNAVEEYSKAITVAPENPDFYQKRGDAYQAMGDSEKAETDYEEAKRLRQEIHNKD